MGMAQREAEFRVRFSHTISLRRWDGDSASVDRGDEFTFYRLLSFIIVFAR
jgi:hypothetical protein